MISVSANSQSWMPETTPVSESSGYGEWYALQNGVKLILYPSNYVGYVSAINEASDLFEAAGFSLSSSSNALSIVPSYLRDESLSSSTMEMAVSVGSAKIIRSVEADGFRIILILSEDSYSVAVADED